MNAILFDLDGTLWETVDTTLESVNEIARKYHLKEINRETICKGMGKNLEECAALYMPDVEKQKRIEIMKEMLDYNSEKLSKIGGNCYPEVEKVLKRLQERYFLAIVSNCGAGYIESFLDSSHLGIYFKDYIAASKEGIPKSDAILKIIKRNSISSAIYIGDTAKDLEASKEAGIPFIHAKYGFESNLETQYSILELRDLPLLLEETFKL